jgi:invasion protein IalB
MRKFLLNAGALSMLATVQAAQAQSLNISNCLGYVVLQQSSAVKEPQLTGQAPKSAQLQAGPQGWALRCQASRTKAQSGEVKISGARINQAVGPGAVATQNIGGSNSSSTGDEPPVTVSVPVGWRLIARGWTGSLRAEGGPWQADIELSAGEMSFSTLKDSQVVIDVGSVSVQELTGRFNAHMRGAGSLEVARMRDPALDLQLSGAGSMEFKGRAASARVRATGIGSIEIEQVVAEPVIQASSLVTIDIGR